MLVPFYAQDTQTPDVRTRSVNDGHDVGSIALHNPFKSLLVKQRQYFPLWENSHSNLFHSQRLMMKRNISRKKKSNVNQNHPSPTLIIPCSTKFIQMEYPDKGLSLNILLFHSHHIALKNLVPLTVTTER